jgi:hypothetical protein
MKVGSEEHKQLFCQWFMSSHRLYEAEQLPWPQLDGTTLERLQGIPFWDEALHTEKKAGKMLDAYAATVADPMIRAAIALQGREEARHGRVIEYLIDRYNVNLPIKPEGELPANLEPAFIKFGYGECFDSFFAFGLFEIARQAGLMPEAFFTIFDPILDEEARHMVFFINWIAYKQVQEGKGWLRPFNSLWQYTGALQRRLDNLSGMTRKKKKKSHNNKGFTATGVKAFTLNLTVDRFLEVCIQENLNRMSKYDSQLLRPEFLPVLTEVAYRSLKLLPKRKSSPVADVA